MDDKLLNIIDCINSIKYYGEYKEYAINPNNFNTNVHVENASFGKKYRISIPKGIIDDFEECDKDIMDKVSISEI